MAGRKSETSESLEGALHDLRLGAYIGPLKAHGVSSASALFAGTKRNLYRMCDAVNMKPGHRARLGREYCTRLDHEVKSWQAAPPLRSKRGYLTAVAVVNEKGEPKVYTIGGQSESGSCLDTVECLDLKNKQWVEGKPMTSKRLRCAATVNDGKIYVVGGVAAVDESPLDSVEVYDTSTHHWSALAPMLACRCDAGIASVRGCLHVAGGFNGDAFTNKVERCDLKTGKWSAVASMNENRSGFGLISTGDGTSIYAIGGFNGSRALDTMERFDVRAGKWNMCPHRLNAPRFGASMAMAVGQKKIYAVGGWSGWQDKYRCSTECFDFAKDIWVEIPSMKERRSNHGIAIIDGDNGSFIYAIGGMVKNINGTGAGKPTASVEKLRLCF
mmetsp:Transcript_16634/g.40982  ORF Transcript_16634/g.40982 Transcript_16634/m.40982 type:complete len:385 (-) Transcript_16634:247-1401(-)